MAETETDRLSLRLFASFEATNSGAPLPRLRTRKGQWLLALLALRSGREVTRDWLAGTLWPDSPEPAALANLRSVLQDLRRALGSEASRLSCPTTRSLRLDLSGAFVDVREFDLATARGDPASLQQAVELYRGPLLEECREEWAFQERQARQQAYLEALDALALAEKDTGAAEGYLRQAIAIDPLRDSAHRQLMQAMAAAGNYAAALQVYRELRERLHREINAAPDAETTALYRQLRTEAQQRAQAPLSPGARPTSPSGQPAASLSPPMLARETLTFLFTDIEGSARHWEEHPEAMSALLARHDALLQQAIEEHGGVVFKRVGDAFCAAFATAPEALAGALTSQRALSGVQAFRLLGVQDRQGEPACDSVGPERLNARTPERLKVRMALHTGVAEQREGDFFGPPLNRVSRLLETGHGGQVLLSQAAHELIRDDLPEGAGLRDLGEHRLRDLIRPERIYQLVVPDLPADFPPLRSLGSFRHNLPLQLTSFVGRERAMEAVKRRLTQDRLVTLTGAGGCGKTRLSLQIAAELVEEYPDGVWLVELASLSDEQLVPQAVVSVLGMREAGGYGGPGRRFGAEGDSGGGRTPGGRSATEALIDYLAPRQLLLILDNCEHLIADCATLADSLLRSCPDLRILASSREPLAIAGETTYRVPSLSLPDPRHLPAAGDGLVPALSQYEAVQLFIDRVTSTSPDFAVTNQNAPAVAEVCYRLDGIPLAIELAAARVRVLPVEQLAARLDDRFRLLTGGSRTAMHRHQTLRALIDWSYDLLSEPERVLLARLSVFAGGWTLEAAEAVCAGGAVETWEVLELLTTLVEKSLVVYEERERHARYRLLETMRQYAWDRLSETGAAPMLLQRHQNWFLALAERAEPELERAEQVRWLACLEQEHDNLRAALSWAIELEKGDRDSSGPEPAAAGLRLAAALGPFWEARGHLSEGRRWLEEALASNSGDSEARGPARVRALTALGNIACAQGDLEAALQLCEEGVTLARERGDKQLLAHSLVGLGFVAFYRADYQSARAHQAESLALSLELNDRSGIALALWLRGRAAHRDGPPTAARSDYEESLAIFRELGNKRMIGPATGLLSVALSWAGDEKLAQRYREESLATYQELGDPRSILEQNFMFADEAFERGELATALSLYEDTLKVARQLGDRRRTADLLYSAGVVLRLRGDYEAARRYHEESLTILGQIGARRRLAPELHEIAEIALAQGRYGEAKALFEEADAIDREHNNRMGGAPNALGRVALKQGEFDEARRIFEADLAIKRELGHKRVIAENLRDLGNLSLRQGDQETAGSLAKKSLSIRKAMRGKFAVVPWLELLARVAALQGQAERAARLFGAAEGQREQLGVPLPPSDRADYERHRETASAAMGEAAFAAAWAEGRAMSLDQAIELALAEAVQG